MSGLPKLIRRSRRAVAFALTLIISAGLFVPAGAAVTADSSAGLMGAQVAGTDFTLSAPEPGETSLAAHWADEYINSLYEKGLIGNNIDTSDPDRRIQRAEFIYILNRAFGYTEYAGRNPFKDMDGTEWYYEDILIAYNRGYFTGMDRTTADAEGTLTREQAVTLLCRALKIDEITGASREYTDSNDIPLWSRGYINAASDKGFISGYEDGSVRPQNRLTLGEAARIFYGAVGVLVNNSAVNQLGYVDGNVTVSVNGATLKDTVITGDLYITTALGLGFTKLENVRVLGSVIVSGAGEANAADSSVEMYNSYINNLIIDGFDSNTVINLGITGDTTIANAVIKSSTYLEDNSYSGFGFKNIEFRGRDGDRLDLAGDFNKVTVFGVKNQLYLDRGSVAELHIDEEAIGASVHLDFGTFTSNLYLDTAAAVTGEGDIANLHVNTDGVTVAGLPDNIVIRAGNTATINGTKMTSNDASISNSRPRILSRYPEIFDIGDTSVYVNYKVNKPGTLYWAITDEEDGAVSAEALVKQYKNEDISLKRGTIKVTDVNKELNFRITGLKNGSEYILSMALEDERDEVSPRKRVTFETNDETVPAFINGYPKFVGADSSYIDMSGITNKNGTIKWAIYELGRTAPTNRELKNGTQKGALSTGTVSKVQKNELENFRISGLEEAVTYDLYMVVLDNDDRVSKLYSMKVSTKDTTPPKFLEGYPHQFTVKPKSVDVKFNVNEDSTVYYVVVNRGSAFPKPIEGRPELTGEELKKAMQENVLTGNNTLKNGKANAKAEVEGKLTISGLQQETPYDVYMVAQDAAGNVSDVAYLYIKTTDTIQPTAALTFSEFDQNGTVINPLASTDTIITFSEEVWNALTNKTIATTQLEQIIILKDLTTVKPEIVELDFTVPGIVIELEENQTIITLPPEVTDYKSGNTYQFVLNNVVDTSGNKMKRDYELPKFTTVSPYVTLTRIVNSDYDYVFEMTPQITNTADDFLFDMLFSVNANVDIKLFVADVDADGNRISEFKNVGSLSDTNPNPNHEQIIRLNDDGGNGGVTLQYIIDRTVGQKNDYVFEVFNKITPRQYAIKIEKLDGYDASHGWDADITFEVDCYIGSKVGMMAVANRASSDPAGALKAQLDNGSVMQVSNPVDFSMTATFADNVAPRFNAGYPSLGMELTTQPDHAVDVNYKYHTQEGDTYFKPIISTTKGATFYYLVLPKDKMTEGNWKPTELEVINMNIKGEGVVTGKYDVLNGNVAYDDLSIQGLLPNTKYSMFSVLTLPGNRQEFCEVTTTEFCTRPLNPPVLTITLVGNTETSATFDISSTLAANVDWAIVQRDRLEGMSDDKIIEIIRNKDELENDSYNIMAFGSSRISRDGGKITVRFNDRNNGMDSKTVYTIYAVGKSIAGSDDSKLVRNVFMGIDQTPPDIKSEVNQITNAAIKKDTLYVVYAGTYSVTFTEPLYFMDLTAQLDNPVYPLTKEAFTTLQTEGGNLIYDNALSDGSSSNISVNGVPIKQVFRNKVSTSVTKNADGAIEQLQISYKSTMNNTALTYNARICDKDKNVKGILQIKFRGEFASQVPKDENGKYIYNIDPDTGIGWHATWKEL